MNHSLEDKYRLHKVNCDTLNPLYRAKNTDYDDSFSKSIDADGYISALTRINDKYQRVKHLMLKGDDGRHVKNESVVDTLTDLANYSLMLLTEYQFREELVCPFKEEK